MTYEPLHHKYRPQTFAELVGQEAIAATLTNALRQQKIAPAYLFTGARGTGKTSSARILAKSLNCLSSPVPTEQPCGQCEVCRAIAKGTALDVIEIDAASNTGVDNMRELIERAQFAPVQCRYKVYVVDECLTGDTLVQTINGLVRIDDPSLLGKQVLSYNDELGRWEYKKVLRWLDQGDRQTLVIKTTHQTIQCTGNHLIRTEQGWIPARDVKEGAKILSPVNVAAASVSTNLGQTEGCADSPRGISSKAIAMGRNRTIWTSFSSKLNPFVLSVLAGVAKNLTFQVFCNRKDVESAAFSPIGEDTRTARGMESGTLELKNSLLALGSYNRNNWDSSMEPCLATVPLPTQINTVNSPDWVGLTEKTSRSGWSIKPTVFRNCSQGLKLFPTKAMGRPQFAASQPVTPSLKRFSTLSSQMGTISKFPWIGLTELLQKDWLGGTWMMDHSALAPKGVRKFSFIQKDTLLKKIDSLLIGLQRWAIQLGQNLTQELPTAKSITISGWELMLPENGWQIYRNMLFPQWITSSEVVKSVRPAGVERVYDIEVEDNHNFVANGLLVHNCHMLSTAAFNALLKTLEEPPNQVVFVLATTDPQRVLPTIISRCQRFDFRRIPLAAMVQHLTQIAKLETIPITEEAITLVAQIAQGGLRDAESLLDQLSLSPNEVTVDQVWDLVGSVPERDLLQLVQAITNDTPEAVLDSTRRLMDRGREPLIVLQNLASFYRDLLIAKTAPTRNDLVAVTSPTWQQLCDLVQTLDITTILAGQQHLRSAEVQLKNTTQPRLWLEVTLMGLLPPAIAPPPIVVQPRPSSASRPQATPSTVSPTIASPRIAQPTHKADSPPTPGSSEILDSPVSTPSPRAKEPEREPTLQPAKQDVEASTDPEHDRQPSVANAVAELDQIWQQIVSHLHPLSKALLNDYGRLLAFDGQTARIGISTEKLLKIAQNQSKNIEKAFLDVFQQTVKISLEVASVAASRANSTETTGKAASDRRDATHPQTSVADHSAVSRAIAPPLERSPNTAPTPSPQNQTPSDQASSQPSQSSSLSSNQPNRNRRPSSSPAEPPPIGKNSTSQLHAKEEPALKSWEEDEVTKAAKQLAEFFAGKVVSANDDLSVVNDLETTIAEPEVDLETAITPSWNHSTVEDEGVDDDDDDVPF